MYPAAAMTVTDV